MSQGVGGGGGIGKPQTNLNNQWYTYQGFTIL